MKILRIRRDDATSWKIMPALLSRMAKFSEVYDAEGLPEDVVELVRSWFTLGDMRLGLWVVLDKDDTILGHLFATPEPMAMEPAAWRYLLIRQALANPKTDIRKESEEVFEEVRAWAEHLGFDMMLILTHKSEAGMGRAWGFQPYKVLMARMVKNRE